MTITHIGRWLFPLLIFALLVGGAAGCKSKKKAAEAANQAAEKARIEQEAALRKQREAEEARKREEEERARREEEAKNREVRESGPEARLEAYFNAIVSAASVPAANNSISEALTLFTSAETPVLIVISESNGEKDYDRPTTIKAYLNYLKDQKKNLNSIGALQFDSSGKISEVELIKNR